MVSSHFKVSFLLVGLATSARPHHSADDYQAVGVSMHGMKRMTAAEHQAVAGRTKSEASAGGEFDFQLFDKNKDGILDRDEFMKAQHAQTAGLMQTMSHEEYIKYANGEATIQREDADPPLVEPLKTPMGAVKRHQKEDDWDDLDD